MNSGSLYTREYTYTRDEKAILIGTIKCLEKGIMDIESQLNKCRDMEKRKAICEYRLLAIEELHRTRIGLETIEKRTVRKNRTVGTKERGW